MKVKIYLLLTVVFVSTKCFSQGYINIIDTTLEWEGCFNYIKDSQTTNWPIKYRFVNKDTVFKGDTFKVLMAYTLVDTFVMGGLREDTTLKKVYGFYSGDTFSELMYNFSFPIGTMNDTLWINPTEPDSNYFVESNLINDNKGKARKHIQLCCKYSPYNTEKYKIDYIDMIEGLGSNTGLIHNVIINKSNKYRQNVPFKPVHFLGIKTVKKIGINSPIMIFNCKFDTSLLHVYQPAKNKTDIFLTYISSKEVQIFSNKIIQNVELFSIEGAVVAKWPEVNENMLSIATDDYTTGWYVLKIYDQQSITYKKLIIKN